VKTHDLAQGSPEWLAFRREHFNASDASAMLGESQYKTRGELLREYATGIAPEIDESVQRRFDDGHRAEALARPLAESIIGQELYPVVGSNGKLAASFDGLTMLEDVVFEHKLCNNDLRAWARAYNCNTQNLALNYRIQLEQQLIVSGAGRALFMASRWNDDETLSEEYHGWYESYPALRERIIAGWLQFEKDLAELKDDITANGIAPETPPAVAGTVQALPAVYVQISGHIDVRENFKAFAVALHDFLDHRLIREPKTDEDFASLEQQIKTLKKSEEALNAAESQMLAQIASVDDVKRQKDMLAKLLRDNRLMAEKLLSSEKERRRAEKVLSARQDFESHVTALQGEIAELSADLRLNVPAPDFVGTIKGLKTLASIEEKLGAALANGKIAADKSAAELRVKLMWFNVKTCEYPMLFADLQTLSVKPLDDFKLTVTARIEAHKKAEAERLEAERERIRAEEAARLEREAETHRTEEARQHAVAAAAAEDDARRAREAEAPSHQGNVVPPVAVAPTLRLGQINERLAPISISADGLSSLGFPPAATDKNAKLYHERDFPRICAALLRHIQNLS